MTGLSPAAQAALDAFDAKDDEMSEVTWLTRNPDRDCLAAAFRAAAVYLYCPVDQKRLAAIADELEAQ